MRGTQRTTFLLASVVLLLGSSCGGDDDGSKTSTRSEATGSSLPRGGEQVELDPAEFSTTIDHPYWSIEPGSRWVYRETDSEGSEQRVVVTVTAKTRTVMGIEARVVHDVVTEDGQLVEDTYDWYAQDAEGNVWYLGENTKEYEDGRFKSSEGSWEAGVDGAQAGVILPARPRVGMTYREEYYEGHAEDAAEVLGLDGNVTVPYGSFDHLLRTKNFTPLEPQLVEHKFYARGIGVVLARTVSGGSDREELLRYDRRS